MLYHFTDTVRLPYILRDKALKPGRCRVGGYPDPDFLWATSDERGDATAAVTAPYRAGHTSLVRFSMPEDMFFPWAEAREHNPAWQEDHVRKLEANAKGADPSKWWCRMWALPLSDVLAIDIRTYRTPWKRLVVGEPFPIKNGLGVEIDGVVHFSAQTIGPQGQMAYQFGRVA